MDYRPVPLTCTRLSANELAALHLPTHLDAFIFIFQDRVRAPTPETTPPSTPETMRSVSPASEPPRTPESMVVSPAVSPITDHSTPSIIVVDDSPLTSPPSNISIADIIRLVPPFSPDQDQNSPFYRPGPNNENINYSPHCQSPPPPYESVCRRLNFDEW